MIKNVLKRRECGTYLATARRHRRRLRQKAAVPAESYTLFIILHHHESPAMSTGTNEGRSAG